MGYEKDLLPQFQPRPIGSGNRENPDLRVSADRAHGGKPIHVDIVVPLKGFGMAHKLVVDEYGNLTEEWA